ncbi:caspase family protein [Candidatus Frankia nodulisporulans]|uniref:caspase family protein n=1 Tax=Candidatus Frankia nodulisporulans TaxID=2060052 RepID=UPI0013CFF15A|nr:caspase family protein [Candidatus Frankia nodulisporulans]
MAPERLALLVGVTDYGDPGITKMPFIADELRGLATALTATGYTVSTYADAADLSSLSIAVEDFVRHAPPGATLLIMLSGHGVHRAGKDYLVPATARLRAADFTRHCLPIDVEQHLAHSRAGDVVVLIDACREGIHLSEKSLTQAWTSGEIRRVGDR